MSLFQSLSYEFVQNALLAALLASLLCGLVGTFVVVKRLVFIGGGVSHVAFGGLGVCHFLGLPPMLGAAVAAVVAALVVSRRSNDGGRSQDAAIGILWTVGMAVGVLFIALTPGYAPNLASYLFGDILAVSRPLVLATTALVGLVLAVVLLFFKELVAVTFDEEFARTQGLPVRRLLTLLMVLIALSVVVLIQVVGAILAIALLTIPPVIGLALSESFRGVILVAVVVALAMSVGGLMISFEWNLPAGPAIVLLGFAFLLAMTGVRGLTHRRRAVALMLVILSGGVFGCTSGARVVDSRAEPLATGLPLIHHLEFLGQAILPVQVDRGAPLGGLSGITHDAGSGLFHAISDDRSERGPARFYTLKIELNGSSLSDDSVELLGWTELKHSDGNAFAEGMIDPESIALTPQGTLVIPSEGNANDLLPPFLGEFSSTGQALGELPLGQRYRPRADRQAGVRNNLGLESASFTPDGLTLFSATENALAQDGPTSSLEAGSLVRILRYDWPSRTRTAEYLYRSSPVKGAPSEDGTFRTAGVVDVLALDEHRLLLLERSFTLGVGNDVRLYEVDLSAATNILDIESLQDHGLEGIEPAGKQLLLHVNKIGVKPDNLEGMTFGPPLEDGSRTLLLISDNNFNPRQVNQLLAFALRSRPVSIDAIQGNGHSSPVEGDWVRGVEGVVTAVDPKTGGGGFWLQGADEDRDEATSTGIYVHQETPLVSVGDRVRIAGGVQERSFGGDLGVTRLEAGSVEILESGVALPAPVSIGAAGRRPPTTVIDDDSMTRFEPCCDGLDFYEALEGMRVRVDRATVIAGTSRFGEIVVLADRGADAALRTTAGGLLLRAEDFNPERILLDDQLAGEAPEMMVGDAMREPVDGVLDYSFGNYKILVEDFPPALRRQVEPPPPVTRERPSGELSVATYNVLNLDPGDGEAKYGALARTIIAAGILGAPDLVGLQEVQDDNGTEDDGVVSATHNLELLTAAIRAAGGPEYLVRQIDPAHNADGGQPNTNIRVAWLLRADRLQPVDRTTEGGNAVTVANITGAGPSLLPSPGRVAPESPAFAGDPARNWEGSRKCLAVEALFRKQPLFLINCHLKSKRGDDSPFGARQPPLFTTEAQRTAQTREVRGLVEQILAIDPQARVIVLGDANEHEFRAPMHELTTSGLTNLIERVPLAERYTFNFRGNSQVLDHILVSPALAERVVDVSIHHINTHLPASAAGSDHDPVSASFDLTD